MVNHHKTKYCHINLRGQKHEWENDCYVKYIPVVENGLIHTENFAVNLDF